MRLHSLWVMPILWVYEKAYEQLRIMNPTIARGRESESIIKDLTEFMERNQNAIVVFTIYPRTWFA